MLVATVADVDEKVSSGLYIGCFGKNDDLSSVPRQIGDWNLRIIEEQRSPGTGYIVAVPSNSRTRHVYTLGRKTWLEGLGFNPTQADLYIRASGSITKRWDHQVAQFVIDNFTIDQFIVEKILSSSNPRKACLDNGLVVKIKRGKIMAGCQILSNIQVLR